MTRGRGAVYPEISYIGRYAQRAVGRALSRLGGTRARGDRAARRHRRICRAARSAGERRAAAGSRASLGNIAPGGALCGPRSRRARPGARRAPPRIGNAFLSLFFSDLSLAGLTHLARHRMLSLLVQGSAQAVARGAYIVPTSVRENAEALERYCAAFARASAYAAAHRNGRIIARWRATRWTRWWP